MAASEQVLVLIAGGGELAPELVREAADLCAARPDWLGPGEALQLPVPPARRDAVREALPALLAGQRADGALLPRHGRRKRVLVCDMDSTAIQVECVDELARLAGLGPRIAAITRRAMAGELDFAASLRLRVALLEGLRLRDIDLICRERIQPTPGMRTLLRTMQAHGAFCALVSGGFTEFSRFVRWLLGFDMDLANELEVEDGVLTGRLRPPLRGPEAKRETLLRLAARYGSGPGDTLAVGDGANDRLMFEAAGLAVAFRPHAVLRPFAHAVLDHADLRAVLYLQGYRREEFVEEG